MKLVYICHPYSGNPWHNTTACKEICEVIAASAAPIMPIAPQVYLPEFMNDAAQRERAMDYCLALVKRCGEVWIIGDTLTAGMRQEIELASSLGKPVKFWESRHAVIEHFTRAADEESARILPPEATAPF